MSKSLPDQFDEPTPPNVREAIDRAAERRAKQLTDKSTVLKALPAIIVAIVTMSLTFGITQATNSGGIHIKVSEQQAQITSLKTSLDAEERARREADALLTFSINRITASIDKLIEQNTGVMAQNTANMTQIRELSSQNRELMLKLMNSQKP